LVGLFGASATGPLTQRAFQSAAADRVTFLLLARSQVHLNYVA